MVPTAARCEFPGASARALNLGCRRRAENLDHSAQLPVVSTIVQQWLAELLRKDGRSIARAIGGSRLCRARA